MSLNQWILDLGSCIPEHRTWNLDSISALFPLHLTPAAHLEFFEHAQRN